jgi:hypothetical protein
VIPLPIRFFARAIYDSLRRQKVDKPAVYREIGRFIVEQWLSKCAFFESIHYGLVKIY